MDIKWYGKNSFIITENKLKVFIDPSEKILKTVSEDDIVVTTRESVESKARVFDWPGEFETKGVLLYSLAVATEPEEIRALAIEIEGIRFCNLANMSTPLTSDQLTDLGSIDVAILPATLKGKDLMATIDDLDPKMVIFSCVGATESLTLPELLKNIEQSDLTEEDKVVIKSKSDIDSENIVYKLLSISDL